MRLNAIGQNDPANLIQVLKVGNIFSQRVSYLYHKFLLRFINGVNSYKVSCENELCEYSSITMWGHGISLGIDSKMSHVGIL